MDIMLNSRPQPAQAQARTNMPRNRRCIVTREIVEYITPKKGKPIPVYATQLIDFSKQYPVRSTREIGRYA